MEKERKIEAPEGCEIEKVEIVDGVAVVTFKEKERKLPKTFEESCEMFPIKKGDFVQGQRTYSGEIINGEFNGFHLVDKQDPSSVVGVIYVENDRCYDVIAKSVVLIEKKKKNNPLYGIKKGGEK